MSHGSFAGGLLDASDLFAPPVNYNAGPYLASVAVADVNGDGSPDLIVANATGIGPCCSDGSLGVLLRNDDGTFQPPVFYDAGGYGTSLVVVADVNGDGKPDALLLNSCGEDESFGCQVGQGTLGVLLGNGDGTFQPVLTYNSGGFNPGSFAVADVNGDGKPDLVVMNSICDECTYGDLVGVLLGNGDGTFQSAIDYNTDGVGPLVAAADVNGDGKPDLVVLNLCSTPGSCDDGTLDVLTGNGDGTFQPVAPLAPAGYLPLWAALADVNGDGKLDILLENECASASNCSSGSDGTFSVLLGNGDGTFQAPLSMTIPAYGLGAMALADFNGDGKLDVATDGSGDAGNGTNGVLLLGNADGTFQNSVPLGAGGIVIAVGDLNGDGKPDLVTGGDTAGAIILLNISPAAPTTTTLVSSPNPSRIGQCATFTATVTSGAGTPTGKVQFMSGTAVLGTRFLHGGRAVLDITDLPVGLSSITAVYEGSAKFRVSTSGTVSQVVLATTTTTLTSAPNPSEYGQSVTFTATVGSGEGAPPDGETVSFMKGKTVLGTGTLSSGSATFETSALKVGTTSVTAVYGGDSSFESSTSKAVKQVVQRVP